MHRSPYGTVWIVLIKKMVLTLEKNHAVRVVHPHRVRREVKARSMSFYISNYRRIRLVLTIPKNQNKEIKY